MEREGEREGEREREILHHPTGHRKCMKGRENEKRENASGKMSENEVCM